MKPFALSQPTISKHLDVLERAGLVRCTRDAQRRPRTLEDVPLKEIDEWLEPFRRFWEQKFVSLDAYLKKMQKNEIIEKRKDKVRSPVKNIGTGEITTPSDREIVITRNFDAPRAFVFEAWTKAEHVRHRRNRSGEPLAVCEIDLRPNGAFRWVNRAPDGGEGHSFTGVYREIAPTERLVFGADASGQGATCPQVCL